MEGIGLASSTPGHSIGNKLSCLEYSKDVHLYTNARMCHVIAWLSYDDYSLLPTTVSGRGLSTRL